MRIAIFGTGYVGLVSGACFAEMGHEVTCVDIDQKKIEMLKNGHIPIYEPHLEEMVKRNQKAQRLSFTLDPVEAIQTASVIFVAVPTQSSQTGDADLTHVFAVTDTLSEHLRKNTLVVIKSTVPVGTTHQVKEILNEKLQAQKKSFTVDVAFNPEFLKEGCAVLDFMKPDRIILGAEKEESIELLRSVYRAFTLSHDRMIVMKVNSAEMTKYAANVMLASRISLMNEFANLCEKVGASIHDVRIGIGSDSRIGYQFLYAGAGYGGSCFPKDIKALKALCAHNHCESDILDAIEAVNARQKMVLFHKLQNHFKDLKGKVITLLGLSFKPDTDDIREAPSLVLIELLIKAGCSLKLYDPASMEHVKKLFPTSLHLTYEKDEYAALTHSDAFVLVTEWKQFRHLNFEKIYSLMKTRVIFDGRNQYSKNEMTHLGFKYFGIGI